jgi:hypothetical protein
LLDGGEELVAGPALDTARSMVVRRNARRSGGGRARDVRGRRSIPLFRRAGAAEAGAIDLVTPIVLWSANDAKQASNMADGRFAGTIWLLMPQGARPEPIAHDIEHFSSRGVAVIPPPVPPPGAAAPSR